MSNGDLALAIMELDKRMSRIERKFAALKTAERRKTVRAKRPVQQRKGETVLSCSDCDSFSHCNFARSNYICGRFKQRTASPVA